MKNKIHKIKKLLKIKTYVKSKGVIFVDRQDKKKVPVCNVMLQNRWFALLISDRQQSCQIIWSTQTVTGKYLRRLRDLYIEAITLIVACVRARSSVCGCFVFWVTKREFQTCFPLHKQRARAHTHLAALVRIANCNIMCVEEILSQVN